MSINLLHSIQFPYHLTLEMNRTKWMQLIEKVKQFTRELVALLFPKQTKSQIN